MIQKLKVRYVLIALIIFAYRILFCLGGHQGNEQNQIWRLKEVSLNNTNDKGKVSKVSQGGIKFQVA